MFEIGRLLIIIGLFFNFIGVLCLLRMPDVYTRLQSSARSVTLGTVSIMLGVFVCQGFNSTGFKSLFVTGFLILVCPVCVHALAKGAYQSNKNSKQEVRKKVTRLQGHKVTKSPG